MKRRSLNIIEKGLMPEILPEPARVAASARGPRERVRARLKQLTDRATAIAAVASLSAACSDGSPGMTGTQGTGGTNTNSGGGGSGVAGHGAGGAGGMNVSGGPDGGAGMNGGSGGAHGGGGSGGMNGGTGGTGTGGTGTGGTGTGGTGTGGMDGTGGYWVVDPVPEPYVCPTGDSGGIMVASVHWQDLSVVVQVDPDNPFASGFLNLDQVTTSQVGVSANVMSAQPQFKVQLDLGFGSIWPQSLDVHLSFTCHDQIGTSQVERTLRLDTSSPDVTGDIPYADVSGMDAGM